MSDTPERNKDGNIITRDHINNGSRYLFDFNECKAEDGWVSFDTSQDDWYFGVWVHPERREVVTYAEGDISRVYCETPEQYEREIRSMIDCYRPAPAFTTIDTKNGQVTNHYQDLDELLSKGLNI